MTDAKLNSIVTTINKYIILNNRCSTDIDEERTLMRDSVIGNFNSALNEKSINIQAVSNYLLGPVFHLRNIQVKGLAMIFNEEFPTEKELLRAYELTKQNHTILNNTELDEIEDTYYITTIYANTIPDDLKLKDFKPMENVAIDLLFEQARKNYEEENNFKFLDEMVKHRIYKHKNNKEFIRIVNYVIPGHPARSSDFSLITGNRFTFPEAHITLALLPVLSPEIQSMLTPEELDLFKILAEPYKVNSLALKNKLKAVFSLNMYQKYMNEVNVRKIALAFKKLKLSNITNNINALVRDIDSKTRDLRILEERLTQYQIEQFYFENVNNNIDIQLDYILNHPYIHSVNMRDDVILQLGVRVPLMHWDTEQAEILLENIHKQNMSSDAEKYTKSFIKHVLVDQDAVYHMAGEMYIAPDSFRYNFRSHSISDEMHEQCRKLKAGYNPHIEFYECTGTHRNEIQKAANQRDLVLMVETMLNPYKNWNLADGAVYSSAIERMFPHMIVEEYPCIEYNGEMLTIKELYERTEGENNE